MLLTGCAGGPAAPPPEAIQADLDFPPVGTTWVRRSLGYGGERTTRSTVLEEGVHRTRPVFRVSVGDSLLLFDRVTGNWTATVQGDRTLREATPHTFELMWPLWVGKSWRGVYVLDDREKEEVWDVTVHWKVEAHEEVTVPAGTFKAFRLQLIPLWVWRRSCVMFCEGNYPRQTVWYAPVLGVVVKERHDVFPTPTRVELLEYVRRSPPTSASSGRATRADELIQ